MVNAGVNQLLELKPVYTQTKCGYSLVIADFFPTFLVLYSWGQVHINSSGDSFVELESILCIAVVEGASPIFSWD